MQHRVRYAAERLTLVNTTTTKGNAIGWGFRKGGSFRMAGLSEDALSKLLFIPTGKTMLTPAVLSAGNSPIYCCCATSTSRRPSGFVGLVFNPEPLVPMLDAETMHTNLLVRQKELTGFNKAYIEKIRLAIPNAIAQVEMRYRNKLAGRLLHCVPVRPEKRTLPSGSISIFRWRRKTR